MPDGEASLGRDRHAAQRARGRALRRSIRHVTVEPDELVVAFQAGVDERLVARLISLERSSSPFLELEYSPSTRVLRAHVTEPEHRPALAALAATLT